MSQWYFLDSHTVGELGRTVYVGDGDLHQAVISDYVLG